MKLKDDLLYRIVKNNLEEDFMTKVEFLQAQATSSKEFREYQDLLAKERKKDLQWTIATIIAILGVIFPALLALGVYFIKKYLLT